MRSKESVDALIRYLSYIVGHETSDKIIWFSFHEGTMIVERALWTFRFCSEECIYFKKLFLLSALFTSEPQTPITTSIQGTLTYLYGLTDAYLKST